MKFEFSTFKTVASCSILMLTNLSLSGQTKFSFSEKTLKEFNSSVLYPVEYKQITDSSGIRNVYIVLPDKEISINSNELKGQFIEISNKMGFHENDVPGHFLKYELTEKVIEYFDIDRSLTSLIENEETKKLYIINSYVIKSIIDEKEKIKKDAIGRKIVNEFIQLKGYKLDQVGENFYVNTKHYKIQATDALKKRLEIEEDYLKKLDIWFEQREAIRKQTIAMIPKLDHYVRLYRMQRNRMSKADISAWTTLTKSANLLNKKQVDLNDKLFGWTDLNDSDKNYYKYSDEFINYLSASKGVLGL